MRVVRQVAPVLLMGMGGAALGGLIAKSASGFVIGLLAGAWVGQLWWLYRHTQQMRRVVHWSEDPLGDDAPRFAGLLGEATERLQYRLAATQARTADEGDRLAAAWRALEATPGGVLLLDENDCIERANQAAADHFGLDLQRDHQQRLANLVRSPDFVGALQTASLGEPLTLGSPRGDATLRVSVHPYGRAGKLVLSQDVTERERVDVMRRDFVANVSHELRSPLTVLLGFLETLGRLELTEVERRRVLVHMDQQARRMQLLVSDLLLLARVEGAPRPSTDQWLAVDELLHRIDSDMRSLDHENHPVSFAVEVEGTEICGDETQIYSALWNLVSNALRHTPAGCEIRCTWRVRETGSFEFVVADRGPGIAPEHLPRLTERFYRVGNGRSAMHGTGLGLAIVKHVMLRHAGELVAESQLGSGSTFRLVFPPHRCRRAAGKTDRVNQAA